MLSQAELVDLYRSLRDTPTLSVYLDTDQHDPAERAAWRTVLDRLRSSLDAPEGPEDEAGALASAWTHVEDVLPAPGTFFPGRGWVAFATAAGLQYGESVPVEVPNLARWERGIRAAPYVRALTQEKPRVVALVDSRKARIFEYREGALEEVEDLRADTFVGDLSDVGVSKRSSSTSGVRGATATDVGQRTLQSASDRMLRHVASTLVDRIGSEPALIAGGPHEIVARLTERLPAAIKDRTVESSHLHLLMGREELRDAVRDIASEETRRSHRDLLDTVLERARAGGRSCLGEDPTRRALEEMRVDTLLLSRALCRTEPDVAEEFVRLAFDQDARVAELGGAEGERLDVEGEGVGARLRY